MFLPLLISFLLPNIVFFLKGIAIPAIRAGFRLHRYLVPAGSTLDQFRFCVRHRSIITFTDLIFFILPFNMIIEPFQFVVDHHQVDIGSSTSISVDIGPSLLIHNQIYRVGHCCSQTPHDYRRWRSEVSCCITRGK